MLHEVHLRAVVISLLLCIVPVSGCGTAVSDQQSPEPAGPRQTLPLETAPPLIQHAGLGRGRTVDQVLEEFGIPTGARAELISILGAEIDLRRLPTGTGFATSRNPAGRLTGLACRASEEEYVFLEIDESGRTMAEKVAVPVSEEVTTAGGTVETSVAQALSHVDNNVLLTMKYADIFQWDVDLLIEPRPGDRVCLAYIVRRLARDVPELPYYRNGARQPGSLLAPGRILAASYSGEEAEATAVWVPDGAGGGEYYAPDGSAMKKTFLKSPLNYRRVSSGFSGSRRHPITRRISPHYAVDLAAPSGTPVVSAADGKVISAGWDGHLGRAVRIRHGSEYVTIYGHLKGLARGVRKGASVKQNQLIGFVGATGRATGPHLHYAMLHRGSPINPLRFRSPSAAPLPDHLKPELDKALERWKPVLERLSSSDPAQASSDQDPSKLPE